MRTDENDDHSVFFGDMNLHVPAAYSQPDDLRARIVLHIVLSEPLVIGDSHSLNSPMFRSLVAGAQGGRTGDGDLAPFLRHGHLRVARRDSMSSFLDIRNAHAEKNIDDVPPPEYAAWLDEVTDGHIVEYSAPAVSVNFKTSFVERLDRRLRDTPAGTPPLYVQTLEMMRDWALAEETLLYKRIRETYDRWRTDDKNSAKETEEAVSFIERSASSSYHLAVPQAIAVAVTGPRNDELIELPSSLRPTESVDLPYSLVNHTVWQRVGADALTEILTLDSRRRMLAELATSRAGGARPGGATGGMAAFADEVDGILQRAFDRERDAEVFAAMRHARLRARLTGLHDDTTGAAGLRLHAVGRDCAGPGEEDDFDIVSMPVAVTDTEPWIEPDHDARKPNARVVAGTGITPGPAPSTRAA
ncbi:hypothetical protein [Couchioplanes azureus]|nr:hypothetical protein [Couchioplanes caeruleus]